MNQRPFLSRDDFQDAARQFRAGRLSLAEFTERICRELPDTPPSGATRTSAAGLCMDIDRPLRCGFPEAIYGAGKSLDVLCQAIDSLLRHDQAVLITRVDGESARKIGLRYPGCRMHDAARTLSIGRCLDLSSAKVVVVTAGTTDFPIAAEAAETLYWMGVDAELIQDVGVAGPERLRKQLPRLEGCHALVVAAGFEGALPSVVGGHVDCPVIGLPTSNGYGSAWPGLPALLAMLNSCAPNVTLVNVDAGFKAGYVAGLIAKAAVGAASQLGNSKPHLAQSQNHASQTSRAAP